MKYWTHSHNSAFGCTKVSPGCACCWAEAMAKRMSNSPTAAAELVDGTVGKYGWTGQVNVHLNRTDCSRVARMRWPQVVAMCWMSDLFHESVPESFILAQLKATADASRLRRKLGIRGKHRWLYLTKRYERMRKVVDKAIAAAILSTSWRDHWFGASCCTAKELERASNELVTFSAHTWLSLEPLVSEPDLTRVPIQAWDWVVLGGMSGGCGLNPQWARAVREWCANWAPFLFKQWGGHGRQPVPDLDGNQFLATPWGELVEVKGKWEVRP
jgi:protein gp37